MVVSVIVNYPEDMSILEKKAAEVFAEIIVKKLSVEEVDKLISILKDDNTDMDIDL